MKRPFLFLAAGMLSGLLALLFHGFIYMIPIVLSVLLCLFFVRKSLLLYFLVGLFLGLFTSFCYQYSRKPLLIAEGSTVAVYGTVKETGQYGFLMRIERYDTGDGTRRVNPFYSFFVTVNTDDIPDAYSTIIVEGIVRAYQGPSNPGQFDASSYYPSVGSLYEIQPESIRIVKLPGRFRTMLQSARNAVSERVHKLFPGTSGGLPMALLLGDKKQMEEDQRELYERFGLAHILTVSGLHIGLFANILLAFLISFFERKTSDRIALLILILYGFLCGFRISCIRAVFSFLISSYGRRIHRSFDRISANAFLMMVILFLKPYSLTDMSFQLSFGAGFLLAFAEIRPKTAANSPKNAIRPKNAAKVAGKVFRIRRTSTILQIGLLPFQIQSFYTFSPFGILFNLALLLLIEVLFLLTLCAVTASFVLFPLGLFFAGPVYYTVLFFEKGMRAFSRLQFLTVPLGHQSSIRIILFVAMFGFLMWLEQRSFKSVWLFLLPLWVVFVPYHGNVARILNLSVGQGDCAVIMQGAHVIVIDCGSLSKTDVGEHILKSCLFYYGYGKADYVFLSHTDEDHINGIRNCTQVFGDLKGIFADEFFTDVRTLLMPAAEDCGIVYTKPGEQVYIGSLKISFLHGADVSSEDPNDRCQLLCVTIAGYDFLFLGDISSGILDELDNELKKNPYLIKVPHHGSIYSFSEDFYLKHRAKVYAVSVGYNHYGHPANEVTETLGNLGKCYVTKEDGAVITEIRNGECKTYSMFQK